MTKPPAMILVDPQMGENIGAAARVMKNFGVSDLRLVRPRDGWPNPKAIDMAKHASDVIENAKIFETTQEAVADLTYVGATSARMRDMVKPLYTPRQATEYLVKEAKTGILFGPERMGLCNEDIVLADCLVTIPVSEEYPSINLAQSVAIISYEWKVWQDVQPAPLKPPQSPMAPKSELIGLFEHLEGCLDAKGFYAVPEKRPKMVQNLRNIFQRSGLSEQEVRTLRGVIRCLDS